MFQMPIIPEFVLKYWDFDVLMNLYYPTRGWSKEDSEAFAYVYSHPGLLYFLMLYIVVLKLYKEA